MLTTETIRDLEAFRDATENQGLGRRQRQMRLFDFAQKSGLFDSNPETNHDYTVDCATIRELAHN